jgi:hypothetical protein
MVILLKNRKWELENRKYITTNGIQAVKKVRKSEDRRL